MTGAPRDMWQIRAELQALADEARQQVQTARMLGTLNLADWQAIEQDVRTARDTAERMTARLAHPSRV